MSYCNESKRKDKYCPASKDALKCRWYECPEEGQPLEEIKTSYNPVYAQKLHIPKDKP